MDAEGVAVGIFLFYSSSHAFPSQWRRSFAIGCGSFWTIHRLQNRYAAERATYRRGVWPTRYVKWVIVARDAGLIGERVQLITDTNAGTVIDTAYTASGKVSVLRG